MRRLSLYLFAFVSLLSQAVLADGKSITIVELDEFEDVWMLTTPGSRVATLRIEFAGGTTLDPEDQSGLIRLAMSSLNSAIEPQPGGRIMFSVEPDHSVLTIQVLQADLRKTLTKITTVLKSDFFFTEEMFERTRRQILSYLTSSIEDSYSYSKEQWWHVFRGIGPTNGITEHVENISYQETLTAAHKQIWKMPVSASIIGDVDAPNDEMALKAFFLDLFSHERPKIEPINQQPEDNDAVVSVHSDARETSIVFGSDIGHNQKDFFVATIVAHVLGGSISQSRLGTSVRFEGGLAYIVETNFIQRDNDSALVGYIGTSSENAGRVIKIIDEEWSRLTNQGLTHPELASAKDFLIDSFSLAGSDARRLAVQMEKAKRLGFGTSYFEMWKKELENVSMERVDQYLQKLAPKSSLKILLLGSKL